jgi:hypothetical protein
LSGIFDSDNFKPSVVLMPFEKNVQTASPDENYVLQVINQTFTLIVHLKEVDNDIILSFI